MPQLPIPDKKVNTGAKYPTAPRPVHRSIRAVCAVYGSEPADMQTRCRTLRLSHQRFLVFWLSRQTNVSFAEIGRRVGGYDHSTVLHGCGWVERKRASDPGYFVLTEWLLAELLNPSRTAPEPPPEPVPPEPPLPPSEPKKAVRRDAWAAGNSFYGDRETDKRASRAFLERQNERFLAALAESGERP